MDRTLQERPLVSYIVPTYNRPELLERALESIASQAYSRFEAVVVNDAVVIDTGTDARDSTPLASTAVTTEV